MIKISFLIPCFNSEKTIDETLYSVFNQKYQNWEALIINDGSSDTTGQIAQKWVNKDERFRYYEKKNGGLASARNYGVKKAIGTYLIPLDSDNIIMPFFTLDSVRLIKNNPDIDVIYGDAEFFGDKQGIWEMGSLITSKIILDNYIDAFSIIKKTSLISCGGYDENMPFQGHEDWDLWLSMLERNFVFYYHKKIVYKYRVLSNSMIRSFSNKMKLENQKYIMAKHSDLYLKEIKKLRKERNDLRMNKNFISRLFLSFKK